MSTFSAELEILEREATGPLLLKIKRKAFLEGAVAVLSELAEIPAEMKAKHKKVDTEEVVQWAQKKIDEINRQLNEQATFELIHMLAKF